MMKHLRIALMLGAAALVCGCEARIGGNESNVSNGQASAEGKAEEGKVAFSAPGLDFKFSIPLDEAQTEHEGKILYPGSRVTGVYIAAQPDGKAGGGGEVELRFAASDPPDKIAAWYRDPARAQHFTLGADGKDGAAFVMAGTEKDDDASFKLRLEAKESGTDGRLTLRDRN